ncbi:protein of unknown function [Candidatus Filomicrobium marinum]|nr:protein of unknown function [Candidatus Filomicrobium marinum]
MFEVRTCGERPNGMSGSKAENTFLLPIKLLNGLFAVTIDQGLS